MVSEFHFITIFPDLIRQYLSFGLLGKALEKGLFAAKVHNLRDYAENKTQSVDDRVYGGGPGMVFRPEPLARAIQAIRETTPALYTIYPSPTGKPFVQADAARLVEKTALLFICGRYEGIDQRVIDRYVDEELSLGDFVLAGGELPALAMTEASARMIPAVIGHEDVHCEESFSAGLLEYPHYTRPETFDGMAVPPVLLSGNHAEIQKWREKMSIERTEARRPDLLKK